METSSRVQASLWIVFAIVFWSPQVNGQDLSLILTPGLDQLRNHEEPGFRAFQLVRGLPPTNEPFVFTVKVPEAWISSDRSQASSSEVGPANDEHFRQLRKAMTQGGIFGTNDPLLFAERVVALLRPMEINGIRAPARHTRIWPLWESLVYSRDVDTLSIALAAVQFLESNGVPAKVASYPAITTSICFGVELNPKRPRNGGGIGSWAQPVGDRFLLPVALSAKPVPGLQPEEVRSWAADEIVDPSWAEAQLVEPEIAPIPKEFPDLISQKKSLGFLPDESPIWSRYWTLSMMLAISASALIGWLAMHLRRRHLRKKRVALRRKELDEGRF